MNQIISLEFPSAGVIRARKVVSRSNERGTGKYPSWKMRRMLHWESISELKMFRLLDVLPSITTFAEQPLTIFYRYGDENHRHYPDLLVTTASQKFLIEVKMNAEGVTDEIRQRTKFLTNALPELGYQYLLLLADCKKIGALEANVQTILRHGRKEISLAESEIVRLHFKGNKTLTWGDVVNGVIGSAGRKIVCRSVLEGTLTFQMQQPLMMDTQITQGKSELHIGDFSWA